ncbi:MAG: magnesium transporter CorA family protein [Bradyrhizobiaceae bacterium]|nr:magnesium transporter CorA family protein [Bradyrhizobiaceae bacterium]
MVTVSHLHNGMLATLELREALAVAPTAYTTANTIWIDMQDATAEEEQSVLADWFGVNDYVMEDIRSSQNNGGGFGWNLHPPKMDEFPTFLFMVYRSASIPTQNTTTDLTAFVHHITPRQINVLISPGVVITHACGNANAVETLRRSVRRNPNVLQRGSDYIAAMLADAIVDDLFTINEALSGRFEELEKVILRKTSTLFVVRLQRARRLLLQYRASATRMADMIGRLAHLRTRLIDKSEGLIFGDVHDHMQQAIEQVDLLLSESTNLIELHFSMSNSRLNEIMRRLTALSTIFLPITFITSWYGMNFEHMPELEWEVSYPILMSVMVVIVVVILAVFRKRGWLG